MKIKIYFNEKPVYLCDKLDKELTELTTHPDTVFVDEFSTPAINSLLHEIKKTDFHAGIVLHQDLEALKRSFFKHFVLIEAAGGIVQNEKKELLFIRRRGKWDLPKGKMEKGENEAECAEREITEETGVNGLKFKKKVGETYHTYDEFGKHILKVSHWFYFTCTAAGQELAPQLEEDITETKWIATRDIKTPMNDTYENIKDIMRRFFDEP
ncbi:MAG: NUDIX domain-containing protein [Chitinophagaceae bacterium]|nr:MAG: NUDIX domain-containing protein [Chitinophagaceae bacterium]